LRSEITLPPISPGATNRKLISLRFMSRTTLTAGGVSSIRPETAPTVTVYVLRASPVKL
jgi:hypothetical protein